MGGPVGTVVSTVSSVLQPVGWVISAVQIGSQIYQLLRPDPKVQSTFGADVDESSTYGKATPSVTSEKGTPGINFRFLTLLA